MANRVPRYSVELFGIRPAFGRDGYEYEVTDQAGALVAMGWAAGGRKEARAEAIEHATLVIDARVRAKARSVTG